jgi:hypothetical protein
MKRLIVAVGLVVAGTLMGAGGAPINVQAANGGNSGAAHACQEGGYLTYVRAGDLTPFTNAGDCVSYATQQGATLIHTCTVAPAQNIGCFAINSVALEGGIFPTFSGNTLTLTGLGSFSSDCTPQFDVCRSEGGTASGGGVYSIIGPLASFGTWTVNGLIFFEYAYGSPCASSGSRFLTLDVTLTSSTGTTTPVELDLRYTPMDTTRNYVEVTSPSGTPSASSVDFIAGPQPTDGSLPPIADSITC